MRKVLTLSLFVLFVTTACLSPLGGQAFHSQRADPSPAFLTHATPSVPNALGTPIHYTQPLCVLRDNTVYLRSTAGMQEYPVGVLKSGDLVYPNGGVSGVWLQASTPLGDGWISALYVGTCVRNEANGLVDHSAWEYR